LDHGLPAPSFVVCYGLVGGDRLFELTRGTSKALAAEGVVAVSIDDLARLMREARQL
jgi:hypothetical protein